MIKLTSATLFAVLIAASGGCALDSDVFGPTTADDDTEIADLSDDDVISTVEVDNTVPVSEDELEDASLTTAGSFNCDVVVGTVGCADTDAPREMLALNDLLGGEYLVDDGSITVWTDGSTVGFFSTEAVTTVIVQSEYTSNVCNATGAMAFGHDDFAGSRATNEGVAEIASVTFCGEDQ
jgi:hypothetical protein